MRSARADLAAGQGRLPRHAAAAAGLRADRASWRLYQFPIFTRMKIASSAASANHTDRSLPEGNHDQRGQQGPQGASGIAADLERSTAPALCDLPRRAGPRARIRGGRPTNRSRSVRPTPESGAKPGAAASAKQSAQRETHPRGQRIGSRMEVGQPPGDRLQERRG